MIANRSARKAGQVGEVHTLSQIDPRKLARKLVIFTPTHAEIDELLDRARYDVPEIGPNHVVHQVVAHNPDCFWAIARRSRFDPEQRRAEGFQAYLMLNGEGLNRLLEGTLQATSPDLALLTAQHEKPAAIYIWCVHAWGPLSAGMALTTQKISTPLYSDVDVYGRVTTAEGHYTARGLGFERTSPGSDLYIYRRSQSTPQQLPIYDTYSEDRSDQEASITVVRTIEDLVRVMTVRSVVFVGEQRCPYREEFDGNDFSGTHLLGYAGSEPAAALRIRYFAQFAKLERLAVRSEFRGRRLAQQIIRAGIELCRMKGYTRIYGQSERSMVNWYKQFGFRVPNEGRTLVFSDFEFVEIVLDQDLHPEAISMETDPYKIVRPEGGWHKAGVLEKSAARAVTRPGALRG